jgi:hypothetical protein
MVDLKSCDIANSVPNSSLTYNTRSVEEPMVVLRGLYLTYANEQLWRNVKVSAQWSGETLRESWKDEKDYMNPEDKASKGFTLTISLCKLNRRHPLPLAQGILPK